MREVILGYLSLLRLETIWNILQKWQVENFFTVTWMKFHYTNENILVRCPSNDQQLLYGEERAEDLIKLKDNITDDNGIIVSDVMRVFKGDMPAAKFEAGQQKVVISSVGHALLKLT